MTHQDDEDADPEVVLVALAETAALGSVAAVVVEVVTLVSLFGIGIDRHPVGLRVTGHGFKLW